MSVFKRIFLSILISIFLLLSISVPKAYALTTSWYNQDFKEWYNKVYNGADDSEIFGERYTAAQVDWIIYSVLSWPITKIIGPNNFACLLSISNGEFTIGGCLDSFKSLFKLSENFKNSQVDVAEKKEPLLLSILSEERPISGIGYFRNLFRKFNLIPQAKAQGTGFGYGALEMVRVFWVASRNITYFLLILIILAMAFMIMFRVKISPQTVITVQSALPKIVTTLILITFSYAIAGFMVDLMYVVIGLISLTLWSNPETHNFLWFGINGATGAYEFMTKGLWHLGIILTFVFYSLFFMLSAILTLVGSYGPVGIVLTAAALLFPPVQAAAATILPFIGIFLIILWLVLLLVLIWNSIRVVWMLFRTFANLILLVIISPFQILLGAVIPGIGFGSWLRNFASSLAVYPITGLLLVLAFAFLGLGIKSAWSSFLPETLREFMGTIPFIGTLAGIGWPPLLLGNDGAVGLLFLGISFVIMTIIPRTAEMIQALIRGQQFNYGNAIGEAVGPARWLQGPVEREAGWQAAKAIWPYAQKGNQWAERGLSFLGRRGYAEVQHPSPTAGPELRRPHT